MIVQPLRTYDFCLFLRERAYTKDFPVSKTLEFSVISNLILFFVTNANIINFDFSKKFYNFSSIKYKTLYYQT